MNNNIQARTPTRRKRPPQKKYNKTGRLLLVMAVASLLAILVIFIVGFIIGYRYITVKTDDGTIKYFGTVDATGMLKKGTLYFSNGNKGLVDGKKSTITYTNGDVYTGGLSQLQKNGEGTLKYKNGDVYEGGFKDNQFSGKGVFKYKNGDVYEANIKKVLWTEKENTPGPTALLTRVNLKQTSVTASENLQ